jgi:hypothetical protein
MTGCSAHNLDIEGAITFHSWAGFGLAHESVDALWDKFKNHSKIKKTWKEIQVIVIDEGVCLLI